MFSTDIFNINSLKTIEKKTLIGQGSYGCVIQPAVSNNFIKEYINYDDINQEDVGKLFRPNSEDSFKKELKILNGIQKIDIDNSFTVKLKGANAFNSSIIKDDNVLKCLDIQDNNTKSYNEQVVYQIILENGGKELYDVPKNSIQFDKFIELFKNLLRGIQKLHNYDIIHQDIKPANILISDKKISVIDFGISDKANNIYNKNNKDILEYLYPFYPPEFYIASLLLKYRNNKERFVQKLDTVLDTMQKEYFHKLFKESQIYNIRNQLQDFINDIKLHNYDYHNVFNKELAYKCDIYGIGFIIRELANKIIYTSENQKIIVYNLYKMCTEVNPYKRTSLNDLISYIQTTSNIKSLKTLEQIGGNKKNGMKRLYISKIELKGCNHKTPCKCKKTYK
jgi:serine/threonine protein kinase